jgi:hypothetical protein
MKDRLLTAPECPQSCSKVGNINHNKRLIGLLSAVFWHERYLSLNVRNSSLEKMLTSHSPNEPWYTNLTKHPTPRKHRLFIRRSTPRSFPSISNRRRIRYLHIHRLIQPQHQPSIQVTCDIPTPVHIGAVCRLKDGNRTRGCVWNVQD